MDGMSDQEGISLFSVEPPTIEVVRLSHLNNKSSVLCPNSQNITSQYMALQQLDAHKRMISRAKGIVDTSAPQSLQSYISVTNRQKKKLWNQVSGHSKSSEFHESHSLRSPSNSRVQAHLSEDEDNASLNASSVSKAVQTGIPFVTLNSKTADKISWYLDALSQGELLAPPFVYVGDSRSQSARGHPTSGARVKAVNGDILETHVNCFRNSKKPFSPRILAHTQAKSKIKDLRCYNPPFRRKKKSDAGSSDTFESYDQEEDSNEEEDKGFSHPTENIETQINRKSPIEQSSEPNSRLHEYLLHHNKEKRYMETTNHLDSANRNEEDKYLDFLSKVTEDILRSGVYSDKAIQQAFEFHMQFYQEDENKDKLQSLLSQVLDGLKISNDDPDDLLNVREPLLMSFSRPNSPPEKEIAAISSHAAVSVKTEQTEDFQFSLNHAADFLSNKNNSIENAGSFRLPPQS